MIAVAPTPDLLQKTTGPTLAVRLFPIIFFVIYLTGTVLLFAYGPWVYPMQNTSRLYIFLAFSHAALLLGYLSMAFRAPAASRYKISFGKMVMVSSLVALAVYLPTSGARTGHVIPHVIEGLNDPGVAYTESLRLREAETGAVEYLRIFLGPVLTLSYPVLWFALRRLTILQRILGFAVMLATILLYISMGTNKAIADSVLLLPWLVLAGHVSGVSRISKTTAVVIVIAALTGFGGFIAYFAQTAAGRAGSIAVAGYLPTTRAYVDPNNAMVRHLPDAAAVGAYGLTHYLSAGYYAVYLSLKEPFVPCYGVGNSVFLFRQAARFFGDKSIERRPYPVRIEKYGWDSFGLWSSIYPWLASDVGFPGVIVLVFFIGRLFAMSWIDVVGAANPFAVVVFAHFIIMLFYFPANNQLMQSGEDFTAFWVLLAVWLFTRVQPSSRLRSIAGPEGAKA